MDCDGDSSRVMGRNSGCCRSCLWSLSSRRQLTELSHPGTQIEVSFRWFEIPVAERLKAWGVRFQTKGRHEIRDGNELMSVVEGYPGVVRHRRLPASGTR